MTATERLRPALPLLILVAVVACGPASDETPAALCDAVDDAVAPAGGVGSDPDELVGDYRELAERYRVIAGELDDQGSARHTRRLADVMESAADDLEGVDLRDGVERLTEVSPQVEEMSRMVNENLPLGIDAPGMEQIERDCAPDLSPLTPSGP